MVAPFETDVELMRYFVIHAKTERALFHVDHVRRMMELASEKADLPADGFIAVHYCDWSETIQRALAATA
jgi:hypothetical protein